MSKIIPFKAIRPTRDKAQLVATRPYYSYKKNVLKAKLESNPFTFLRIINPEFNTQKKTKANSKERFELVKKGYDLFLNDGILIKEKKEKIYLYQQTVDGHEFSGVIAGANLEEYQKGLIKKHEATITSREEVFVNYLDIVGYNAEPVLLTHKSNKKINTLLEEIKKDRPEYEFSTTDKIKHELWVLKDDHAQKIIDAFSLISSLYIADGHHRSASSAGILKKRGGLAKSINEKHFLAFLMDENKIKILEFNRLVKTLNNLSPIEFLEKISLLGKLVKLKNKRKPLKEHEFTFYIHKSWYSLTLNKKHIPQKDPVKCLDTALLTNLILSPILGITDLKNDARISFISGKEDIEKTIKEVDNISKSVLFCLYPISIDQIKNVADNKQIMPPKSTWIEPKLRSGLTIYPIS